MGVKEIQIKATAMLAAILTLPAAVRHADEAAKTSKNLMHFSPDAAARLSALTLTAQSWKDGARELEQIRSGYLFVALDRTAPEQSQSVAFSVIDPMDIPMQGLTVKFAGTAREVKGLKLQCEFIQSSGHPWALAKTTGTLELRDGKPVFKAQTLEMSPPLYQYGTSMGFETKLPKASFEDVATWPSAQGNPRTKERKE